MSSKIREDKYNEGLQKEYINLLRGLFKGTPSGAFLKLAYITGILPIKKYGTQSFLKSVSVHPLDIQKNYIIFVQMSFKKFVAAYNTNRKGITYKTYF